MTNVQHQINNLSGLPLQVGVKDPRIKCLLRNVKSAVLAVLRGEDSQAESSTVTCS